jgi:pimeloyl-ACP methyl ester carboxylesterase
MTISPEYENRFVAVNGLRLHYLDWGGEGWAPLVMLHGVTGNAHHWEHIARAFRSEYRCLALDMRGFGDSQWSPAAQYESTDLAADLAGFFHELQLREAVVFGASWGGLVGLMQAADHPETVARLVLVDVGCEFSQPETAIPSRPWAFESPAAFESFERSANPLPALWTLRPYLQAELRQAGDGWERKQDPVFARRWPFRNRAYWDEARRVRGPALLVRGARSFVLTPEMAQRTAQSIRSCRLVEVPDAGHPVHLDNPPAFEAAVRAFLAWQPANC